VKLIVLKNNVPLNDVRVETPDLSESYEIFVGRAEDCHVLIDDPLMSRHHLVIRNDGPLWYCQKLSQLGVVTVNGLASEKMYLRSGDEIKCGIYSLMVSEFPQVASAAPSPAPIQEAPVAYKAPVIHPEPTLIEEPELEMEQVAVAPSAEDLDFPDELSPDPEPQLSESTDEDNGSMFGSDDAESNTLTTSEFGDDNTSALSEFADEEAPVPVEQEEATRVDRFFVNHELILVGEHAPYDRFTIVDAETFIGRDQSKCQILLDDPEVSSVHAVLKKENSVFVLQDLNSSNGTIHDGFRINTVHIKPGDEFVIGSTNFTLRAKSALLSAEADRLLPVEKNQFIETEEIEEEEVDLGADGVGFSEEGPPEKSIIKRIWKNPDHRKKLIYGIVAAALAFVLFYEEDQTSTMNDANKKIKKVKTTKPTEQVLKLSKELEAKRNEAYEIGVSYFDQSNFSKALESFKDVRQIDPNYKKISSYYEETNAALKNLEELAAQKRAEEEKIKTKKIIEEILVKARAATKERQVQLAESYFAQVVEKDPDNIEVQQLRLELDSWQKEQERIAFEKAAAEAKRKKMVDALSPGKNLYLKKEWYTAILKLEEFLTKKGMDEDLIKEASDMLSDSKNQLASEVGPILGKARSLKEGQDLKNAYEAFLEALKIEPTNAEALNEVDDIRSQLDTRSKRVYREAIIAESLSLFSDAKEKFQEVQQISPTDSEYYKKASEKLKDYLE
jgi:pSer/pThr/pTyr-binding forkhead associated (FHA) protein